MIEEALESIWCNKFPECFEVADLGCSSGHKLGCPLPEFKVSLNDLPTNDFNCIFQSLPAFYNKLKEENGGDFNSCFISAVPGSFYGRLFPTKSLHFVHSSSSLHWLSQVPPPLNSKVTVPINKGKVYISTTSPICVRNAYYLQFQKDFSLFLKSRSEEIVPGGRMVLSLMGRTSKDPSTLESIFVPELLAQALMSMASEGIIKEEKIDSFNFPIYFPSPEELTFVVKTEGSFVIDRMEGFEIDCDGGDLKHSTVGDQKSIGIEMLSSGQRVSKNIRALAEPMLECHFGKAIIDELFRKYSEIMDDHLSKSRTKTIFWVVSFTLKRGDRRKPLKLQVFLVKSQEKTTSQARRRRSG
ncbi:jasmonate O-methyltransferase [Sarracenia purpurea var. burkii]